MVRKDIYFTNGIEVQVLDARGVPIPAQLAGQNTDNATMHHRTISAEPGSYFKIRLIIRKHHEWSDADCLLVAIAYDRGLVVHREDNDYTSIWTIKKPHSDNDKKYELSCMMTWNQIGARWTNFQMPPRLEEHMLEVVEDKDKYKSVRMSPDEFVAGRGSIAVFVQRGHLDLTRVTPSTVNRRPTDPPAHMPEQRVVDSGEMQICPHWFVPLQAKRGGSSCEADILQTFFYNTKAIITTNKSSESSTSVRVRLPGQVSGMGRKQAARQMKKKQPMSSYSKECQYGEDDDKDDEEAPPDFENAQVKNEHEHIEEAPGASLGAKAKQRARLNLKLDGIRIQKRKLELEEEEIAVKRQIMDLDEDE